MRPALHGARNGGRFDDAIVTLSDFGRTNKFVLRLYVAHILRGLAIVFPSLA